MTGAFDDRTDRTSYDVIVIGGGTMDARGVRVAEGPVSGVLTREGRPDAVELADGRALECAAVFVFPRMTPNDAAWWGAG